MNILAIESSCDETAAAIISGDPFSDTKNPNVQNSNFQIAKPQILSNVVVSQIDIFKAYGGVIPEVAARSHLEAILPVIHEAFEKANFKTDDKDDWSKIDAIAVTHTPGLLGSLLIGTLTARTLAILHNKPLYAVHHLKSHIYANWLETEKTPSFPLLSLVISGGHTQIIRMTDHNNFEIIGTTLDDAVGECFDKVAKILGLPYPGGPAIAKAAKSGDPNKYKLPHPQIKNLDFSFSGLKTAVLRAVQKEVGVPISYPSHELAKLLTPKQVADFAASFENTACDILIEKLKKALTLYPDTKSIVIAGGVSANQTLRKKIKLSFGGTNPIPSNSATSIPDERASAPAYDVPEFDGVTTKDNFVFFPGIKFSGDNAAMVGAACFYEIKKGVKPTDPFKLNILPRSAIN
ncbi:tRNA (adenosine(37)-N6)-threonylcarbamoyltransferase complex transferase subunit TsaD [Candidatus Saccharibacteria bacterium]|nr:tRNA (adenosine(37)-N6)-threonylcarbamoyltransferase complex transferase subunit TsaD [Candidatus Saccharibacteria bacterium]